MSDRAYHRRWLRAWLCIAAAELLAGIFVHAYAPQIAPWTFNLTGWIWALLPATYHAGWLKRDKETEE